MMRFFEAAYADNQARSFAERRRRLPDVARYLRNAMLRPLDDWLARRFADPERPVLFLVGAPRSGTTLLYQLIARHLEVAYVSNELARFWSAPLVGARWLDRRGVGRRPAARYRSEYGRDPEPFGPHEFSWFWHYWGDFRAHDDLRGEALAGVDWRAIASRLTALANLRAAPLVVKSLNFTNYQTAQLAEVLPAARFLHVSRSPLHCAQSILEVRRQRYGDRKSWWSVRPHDYRAWQSRPAVEQVVHQIRDIESSLDQARARLGAERFLGVRYEDLVADPARLLRQIAEFAGTRARDLSELDGHTFKTRNQDSLAPELLAALERELERP